MAETILSNLIDLTLTSALGNVVYECVTATVFSGTQFQAYSFTVTPWLFQKKFVLPKCLVTAYAGTSQKQSTDP